MIITTNLFTVPFVVLLWALDCWLFLFAINAVLRRVKPAGQLTMAIAALTDPLIQRLEQLRQRRATSAPQWAVITSLLVGALVVRSLIIRLITVMA